MKNFDHGPFYFNYENILVCRKDVTVVKEPPAMGGSLFYIYFNYRLSINHLMNITIC
jgi:hypothetical protein